MNTPAFVWLIAFPIVAAPLGYGLGRASQKFGLPMRGQGVALVTMALVWIAFFNAVPNTTYTLGAVALRYDDLSRLFAALTLTLGTLALIFSGPDVRGQPSAENYSALLLLLLGLLLGLACATDVFNLWVWFEALTVASYFLVTFDHAHPAALEAGFKYLAQSAVGSSLILLGVAFYLAQTGMLALTTPIASAAPGMGLAGVFFIAGFGVKAALVPLHTWLPDAHSQAPSGISALLSGVVIEAGLLAMLRALLPLTAFYPQWGQVLLMAGALNVLAGNLLALRQTEVKRLLAYSSVSHVGYMLLGVGLTFSIGTPLGAQGAALHFFTHGLLKGLAFFATGALVYGVSLGHRQHHPLTVDDLAGAAHPYPLAALALSLAVLGLSGLPPLAVFASKWQIFTAGFAAQSPALTALMMFAALNSVLSLAYYAPLVNRLYRQTPAPAVMNGLSLSRAFSFPLVLLVGASVLIGVWPGAVTWLTEPAGRVLGLWWQN